MVWCLKAIFPKISRHNRGNSGIILKGNPTVYTNEAKEKGKNWFIFLEKYTLNLKNCYCPISDTSDILCKKKESEFYFKILSILKRNEIK